MNILIIGASKGLGKAFVEGLPQDDDQIIGVSRNAPKNLEMQSTADVSWILADLSNASEAIASIDAQTPDKLDVIIYNLGIWEKAAFSESYDFLNSPDEEIIELINTNVISVILLLKRLMPKLLTSPKPQIILTGSTSGLPQSGQPEVAFGASKFALRGIADALRGGFRTQRLAVTVLQLGDLNTDDGLSVLLEQARQRDEGYLIPIHDVVTMTRALLALSPSSFVKELTLPPIFDGRF